MHLIMDEADIETNMEFLRNKHIKYCLRSLQILPNRCSELDSTRLVIAFFAFSTLDLLNSISSLNKDKENYINWIYNLQVTSNNSESKNMSCGFRGSTSCTVLINNELRHFDHPNIVMTYTALASLLILGDDLSKIDKKGIIHFLKELQLSDGSFRPTYSECENDMRFVYCASCISYILDDWSGVDIDRAVNYIKKSITYEGGIAQGPGLEAHGGSTFCAVASLHLMNRLHSTLTYDQVKQLKRWCIFRQNCDGDVPFYGLQGRPNKPNDACYSFWVGATLALLDSYHFICHDELRKFILSCQDPLTGGISKWVLNPTDPMHTYLGISGLALMKCDDIIPIHPALNISEKAAEHLKTLHQTWKTSSKER